FDAAGQLASELASQIEIPIPVLFDPLPMPLPGDGARLAVVRAALQLGTLALIRADEWTGALSEYAAAVAPVLRPDDDPDTPWVHAARLVEIEIEGAGDRQAARELAERIRLANPSAVLAMRLPFGPDCVDLVEGLAASGVGTIHLYADEVGYEPAPNALDGGDSRFLADTLQEVHHRLVAANLRDRVTLVVSGGIAAAEHVPKAMVCGADAVAVDLALQVALGCALWADVRFPCPVEDEEVDPEWGKQRIVNLMGAWRDQLLEVLGAMGMREVCRLRGELGRTIFQSTEDEAFHLLFERIVPDHPEATPPKAGDGELEGDLRWPTTLILATAEQARTGQPPASGLVYRVGRSGGGFDRLRFSFELDEADTPVPAAKVQSPSLILDLNRRDAARPRIQIPHPWYGAGMSFGSISLQTMIARAWAAQYWDSFTSTGEGGYPDELLPYAGHIITQVATGLFGVREDTIRRARIVEFKYAQGAKPGLGGHLLGAKVTPGVAAMREAMQGTSLFSPFPFHSVYSVEDHKKHVDWIRTINPQALISVKVSTPTDVDMVAVGSYYAGAHILQLDGAYGGTGAAPEVAKKNIAMPLEYA
ncbi:MAG: glutamate synthase-related protein, partial [Anaerolineae bacterium]